MKRQTSQWCFEVSWEVANPVGGIHTVLATKAEAMVQRWGDHYVVMGPIVPGQGENPYWKDEPWIDGDALVGLTRASGIRLRPGRWKIFGSPLGMLVDFSSLWERKDDLLAEYWERFGLDSYGAGYDYEEPVLFGAACARVIEAFANTKRMAKGRGLLVHAHEWIAGSAILETRAHLPEAGTVFTTHATALGRALSSRAALPTHRLRQGVSDQMAADCGVRSKHSMERVVARVSHVFTTVSDVTADECENFLGRKPDIVLPNALSENLPAPELARPARKEKMRRYLFELASRVTGHAYDPSGLDSPMLMVTSGRYEFRNKGIDMVLDSMASLSHRLGPQPKGPKILLFAMLPADALSDAPAPGSPGFGKLTHELRRPSEDPILQSMQAHQLTNRPDDPVHVVFVPRYLDGRDTLVPYEYWELLAGCDVSLFPSWYEPWGYTPMEAVALGLPTVSSDLAGYAHWARTLGGFKETGVYVLSRQHTTHAEQVREFSDVLFNVLSQGRTGLRDFRASLSKLAQAGIWAHSIKHYEQAQKLALERVDEELAALKASRYDVDVVYLSMEFGIKTDLAIYSGGLGILSGDHLKSAQDLKLNLWGIGLAYQEGYFKQQISSQLAQEELPQWHGAFEAAGLKRVTDQNGEPLIFDVPVPDGRFARTAVWKLDMGATSLFLLDPNLDENPPEIRTISSRLYTGDRDQRWAQEYFLGLGAALFLERMGTRPKLVHMNEGHTGLSTYGRIARLMHERFLTFDEALKETRPHTLFTTHTAVPAGHERFEWSRVERGMNFLSYLLRVSPERLKTLGADPHDPAAGFSMTAIAMQSSSKINSVSRLHATVSGALLHPMVDLLEEQGAKPDLLYVTNGVHPQTWLSPDWKTYFEKNLGREWSDRLSDNAFWSRLRKRPDREIWDVHRMAKSALCNYLIRRLSERAESQDIRNEALKRIIALLENEPMVLTFARRFATYKRPELLLRDPRRMLSIIERHPNTLFIFAGKAHPSDGAGKERISRVLSFEGNPAFIGKILFFEDYNIEVAQRLVSGSDVWLNLPYALREASGTSGMKAAMNGVLNMSVSDGWVYEAHDGEVPWPVGHGTETLVPDDQDEIHAREFYRLLSKDVLPTYFERDKDGIPRKWVALMKQAMASSIPHFSSHRMVAEYDEGLYSRLKEHERPRIADHTIFGHDPRLIAPQ